MTTTQIPAQYSTDMSRRNIEQALIAAGKDIDHLEPSDLGLLEDFHTMGRIATSQLVDLIGITSADAAKQLIHNEFCEIPAVARKPKPP